MRLIFKAVLLVLLAHTTAWSAIPIGGNAILPGNVLVRARLDNYDGEKIGFVQLRISNRVMGQVREHREKLGLDYYTISIEAMDYEHLCSKSTSRVLLLVEASSDVAERDFGQYANQKQLEELQQSLKRRYPDLDLGTLQNSGGRDTIMETLMDPGTGPDSLRNLLKTTCGDPNRVDGSRLIDSNELSHELDHKRSSELSADYPALFEAKESAASLGMLDEAAYKRLLKDRRSPKFQILSKARQQIYTIVETSQIEKPAIRLQLDLRKSFAHPLLQQLVLEEIAARFSVAQKNPGARNCELLVTALRLFQHLDADMIPFGVEKANSVLLLYRIFHGAYFSNHRCVESIERNFGPMRLGLPYAMPLIRNPSIMHQRTITYHFLFVIPYKTEKLHEEGWFADVAGMGRVVMESPLEDVGEKTKYFWKEKDSAEVSRFRDSFVLIKEWASRAAAE